MMPRTPFSTPLSRSARGTEERIRNLFQGKRKRPALLLMLAVLAVIALCGSLVAFVPRQDSEADAPPAEHPDWEFVVTDGSLDGLIQHPLFNGEAVPLDAETAAAFAAELETLSPDQTDFAVYDVDGDGRNELILRCFDGPTAGHQGWICDFDAASGTVREQFSAYPIFTFYDNGTIQVGWSHNQTWGELWPYFLYQYDPASDSYTDVGAVSAWNKEHQEQDFPDEIDADGDGVVYRLYLTEDDWNHFQEEPEKYIDGDEYARWLDTYLNGAQEVELTYQPVTWENIAALRGETLPPINPVPVPEALRTVLQNRGPFLYADGTGEPERYEISHVPALFSPDSSYARVERFAVLDLDGDGEDEVVLYTGDVANDMGGYLILHMADGKVYGFPSNYRTFWDLRTDGTFQYSNLVGTEDGIRAVRFDGESCIFTDRMAAKAADYTWESVDYFLDGQPVTEAAYRAALAEQDEKPLAEWYDYTEENCGPFFPSGPAG